MKLKELRPSVILEAHSRLIDILDFLTKSINVSATIIGGSALPKYNYVRMTEDVDLLMTVADAQKFGDLLVKRNDFSFIGHSKFRHSSGIDINLCPEGVVVGHTKFPKPEISVSGIHYIDLPHLLVMKIQAKRQKDRGDYVELIKRNGLSLKYVEENVYPLLGGMDKQWAVYYWKQAQKEI